MVVFILCLLLLVQCQCDFDMLHDMVINDVKESCEENNSCRDKTKLEIIENQWEILTNYYLFAAATKIKIKKCHHDFILELHKSNKDKLFNYGYTIHYLFGDYYLIFDHDFFIKN